MVEVEALVFGWWTTQNDIDNGRLIIVIVIDVAPAKPAEFVIFRIRQPGT